MVYVCIHVQTILKKRTLPKCTKLREISKIIKERILFKSPALILHLSAFPVDEATTRPSYSKSRLAQFLRLFLVRETIAAVAPVHSNRFHVIIYLNYRKVICKSPFLLNHELTVWGKESSTISSEFFLMVKSGPWYHLVTICLLK